MALNFINNGYVAGSLGIGRINPAVSLDVEGKIRSNDDSSGDYLEIFCDGSNTGDSYIENTSNDIQIISAANTSFSTSGSEAVFINSSQKVGIGTDSPTAKLTISSDIGGDGTWVNSGVLIENSASSAECAVVIKNSETGSNYWFTGLNQSNIYKIGYGTGFVNTNVFLQINTTGSLTLDGYDLANKTGTPTYMLGTDADGNVLKVLGGSIPGGGTVTGSGTATYLPKWGSTGSDLTDSIIYESAGNNVRVGKSTSTANFLVYPEQTQAPTNKKYLFHIDGSTNGVGLGYWGGVDSTYGSVVEGIKLIPSNLADHVLTRITPRLEVYPYENPADTTDNTYVTGFVGSSFSIGSENTIGDSGSTNLGIIGFNNKLTGDKMLIVGQGNEVQGNNVSSILVGTTNTLVAGPGQILNSAVVGQNHSIGHSLIRSTYSGINNQTNGNATNVLVAGSGLKISGNNSSILGANNEIDSASNALVGGFNNLLKNNSSSDNINYYGTAMFGWSNSAQNSSTSTNNTKSSLIVGRNNQMRPNSKGAIESMIVGGYNNYVYSGADRGLVVGSNNRIIGDGSLTGQDTPNISVFDSSIVAGNANYVDTIDSVVVGRANGEAISGGGATTYYPIRGKELLIIGNNHSSESDSTKGCFAIGNNVTINGGSGAVGFIGTNMSGGGSNSLFVGNNHSGNNSNSIISGANNNANTSNTSGTSQICLISGRGNTNKGTLNFMLGASNQIYGSSTGNNFTIGNANVHGIGGANPTLVNKTISIGFNNSTQKNQKILIGKNLVQSNSYNTGTGDDCVILGENNDYTNSQYSKSGLQCALIVGASTTSGNRRDALIITNRTGTGSEGQIIMPSVGQYNNYSSDSAAATGGVPLYGLYHNNGDIKIRVS
jgi:hypothetical protein